jgi:hypothetical protein
MIKSVSPEQALRLAESVGLPPALRHPHWRSLSLAGLDLAGSCVASMASADFSYE